MLVHVEAISAVAALDGVVAQVRAKIARSPASSINEQNTKAALIDPILRSLGWDVEDWEEVQREFKVQSGDNPVDYALMDRETRTPLLFLEAKGLGENLDDRRWAGQIMGYAHVAGVKWVVLTNGNDYRIYNAYAEGPVEQKIFRTCCVSDEPSNPELTLGLFSKEQVEKNEIDAIWKSQAVDQKVRAAIEDLFLPEPDASIVNLVKRRVPDLTPGEVKSGLRRIGLRFEFPSEAELGSPSVRRGSASTKPMRSQDQFSSTFDVSLRHLIASGIIRPPLELEKTYKGHRFSARVEHDGTVIFQNQPYNSLSLSAAAARALIIGVPPGRKYPHTNGWAFWRFRDDDGQVRPIDVLRRRYLNAGT